MIPPILTPFTRDEEIYEEGLRNFIRFLIEKGVHGLWVTGSVGLGPYMSVEERKKVAEIVVDEAKARTRVLIHVGTTTVRDSVQLAKHAQDIGADGISAVPSYYLPLNNEEAKTYYYEIATSVDLPLILYHNPPVCGFVITPDFAAELMKNAENIVGVKITSSNLLELYSMMERCSNVGKRIFFFFANSELAAHALISGADGVIPSLANVLPELYVKMFDEVKRGNFEGALEIQRRIIEHGRALRRPRITALYVALRERGIDVGLPRRPFVRNVSEDDVRRIRECLSALNVL